MNGLLKILPLIALIYACGVFDNSDWPSVKPRDIKLKPRNNTLPIVGSHEVIPHSAPYQVGILISTGVDENVSVCGGSLISTRYVLTAAHCLVQVDEVEVRLGAHKLYEPEPSQLRINTLSWVVHEKYFSNGTCKENDIAIIDLGQHITLNDNIMPVFLSTKKNKPFGVEIGRLTGWGKVSNSDSEDSPVLREIFVDVLSNDECRRDFDDVSDSQICTSGRHGRGSCDGDSGGPLVVDNIQIGILSYGSEKCGDGSASVYTRVSAYVDWIDANTPD